MYVCLCGHAFYACTPAITHAQALLAWKEWLGRTLESREPRERMTPITELDRNSADISVASGDSDCDVPGSDGEEAIVRKSLEDNRT
jgi:hypothetical protein